ncbi:sperm-egg fusion protein TMEM95 isoform X2 [Hemicordylus capensis]|uniref:sperm-egg fusion protein TMEM95 isoform X2 n=1 Tax=Hemicordylus capensis TaxID=884348 RepID=UPI002302B53B|nr:sperm-egg fusion protein TMEM95 isoform X2 [Hemicordylus capensis]
MASSTPPTSGFLWTPPWLPTAVVAFCLLSLPSGWPGTEGCLHCRDGYKNLHFRFARLCAQYQKRYNRTNCSRYPWGRNGSRGFALDELSLDLLLEKTHRVFQVIEINQSLADLPQFWDWLHEVKMPAESREDGSATAINCSTCRLAEVSCWDRKTCYPERTSLQKSVVLLSSIAGSCLFLGVVSCALEFRLNPGIATEGVSGWRGEQLGDPR